MMKQFFQYFVSRWFALMVPIYAPATTTDEREMLRKRRLLSGILLITLAGSSFAVSQDLRAHVSVMQLPFDLTETGVTLLSLWINRRGYLKTAASFYISSMFLSIASSIYFLTFAIPDLSLILWALLLLIPVATGLFLPIWGPILLTIIEEAFMSWFVLYGGAREIAIVLPNSTYRIQFLLFACTVISIIGIFSVIYAFTTKKAVMQADRTVELEEAHQTISQAYARLEEAHVIIHKQAFTDVLTELPNHRALMEQLEKDLEGARRYNRSFSLLFFDADHFKYVNDTYGHAVGDAVLRQIGMWAKGTLRMGDTLGRFGGEEFVVLLPEADAQEARVVAGRIQAAIAASPVAVSGHPGGIPITVSIGFSTYPSDGNSEQELLSLADSAMYIAKRLGRNRVHSSEEARQVEGNSILMEHLRQEG
jgi:diguanylate cyclase (GGDEF)-like protein